MALACRVSFIAVALLAMNGAVFAQPVPPPRTLALVGATLVDGTGAPPVPDAVVVIRDGRILAAGPRSRVTVPADAERLDVSQRFVTPGLIDTNVHLVLMTTPEFFVKYEDRFEDIALQSAQVGLKYGLTTMMDSWGPLEPLLAARARLRRGEVEGSRVLIAGNIVGCGGPFSPYFLNGFSLRNGQGVHPAVRERINALWEAGVGPALLAMTPAQAAEAMRAYLARGVDFVKVALSAHGVGPVEPLMFSAEALEAMRAEAKRAGVHFQTHTFTTESLRMAVALDPEMLQHPNVGSFGPDPAVVIDPLIAEIVRKGLYVSLMAIPSKQQFAVIRDWNPADHPDTPDLNEVIVSRKAGATAELYEKRAADVRRWVNAGARFTLGTDMGMEAPELGPVVWGRLGRAHFERMEALQDLGVPRMDILVAATRRGAEAYGLGKQVGTVEAGKIADLLVVDADPLQDIANLRKIRAIVKDGHLVDRDALPTIRVLADDPEARWPR